MMTRKDFELIARAIALSIEEAQGAVAKAAVRNTAYCLAEELRTTNPAFDEDRFLAACNSLNNDHRNRAEPMLDRG